MYTAVYWFILYRCIFTDVYWLVEGGVTLFGGGGEAECPNSAHVRHSDLY